jgi:hypothetical protein
MIIPEPVAGDATGGFSLAPNNVDLKIWACALGKPANSAMPVIKNLPDLVMIVLPGHS